MAFPVTINGRTYTLADFEGTNYVDGFPDALEDFVTQAGDIYNSTSTSSVAIGTGSKSFTTADSGKPYQEGTPLRIADAAAPETNFMDCIVTSYSGTSLVVESIGFGGSGTKSSWTINIGGAKTVDGTLAINQGGTGATTASDARDNLGLGSIATQDADSVNLDGGNIDGTTIGGSSAAAGSFTTVTGSGDMNIDSGTLFVDVSENRVGIGTESPSDLLHVDGNMRVGNDSGNNNGTGGFLTFGKREESTQTNAPFVTQGSHDGDANDLILGAHSDDGTIRFFTGGSVGSVPFTFENDERMRIDSSGNLDMTNGGGDIIMANGAGIDFSASESGGADNSLLDDYEIGTWTCDIDIDGSTGSGTSGDNASLYVKVGNLVTVAVQRRVSGFTSPTGTFTISGSLPFAAANQGVFKFVNRALTATETDFGRWSGSNIYVNADNGNLDYNDVTSGITVTDSRTIKHLSFTFSYYTNA